jgi:hypothetical protein
MALRMGGFTCDSCVIFNKYTHGRGTGNGHEEVLPTGWKLFVDKKYVINGYTKFIKEEYKNYTDSIGHYNSGWIDTSIISKNTLLCDKCSKIFERKIKINKINKIIKNG